MTSHSTLQSPRDAVNALGATVLAGNRTHFRVWAPYHNRVELHIIAPREQRVELEKAAGGYHEAIVDDCGEGARYLFDIGGRERPDPASRFQPLGVHGPSEVISSEFEWHDEGWRGIALEDYVIYELHVGTFTPAGTFEAIIEHLDELAEIGITAVELLPIAQFPGDRNWGYDGVYINAAQSSYGGPLGLKRLADACHRRGLALILDVVYNHLGPEGNYLSEYGPYFTDRYRTPWGMAINFDGAHSDEVRRFFIHNALTWIDEFHVDALRVDAVHAIIDTTAEPFLRDLTRAVHERARLLGRTALVMAESNLNDPRVITPRENLGMGFDTQWSDDFHHSLHALLTGEAGGYYAGFGKAGDLAGVFTSGYHFVGQYSTYRGRKHGLRPDTSDGARFVAFTQNHDQVGNRMLGERLSVLVSPAKLRLAAAAVILSPFLPMIFMGEEYGEKAPFQYFTSHSDPDLVEAVRNGRRKEFEAFAWEGEAPDPHAVETFVRSKLQWEFVGHEEHVSLRRFYRELLRLRRETPALRKLDLSKVQTQADDERRVVIVRRGDPGEQVLIAFNFAEKAQTIEAPLDPAAWHALIDTGSKIEENRITVPPWSFALYGTRSDGV